MAIDIALNPLGTTAQPGEALSPEAERQEIKRLAQQFEALLLTQMMREMRRSMIDDDAGNEGFGSDALLDTANIEFGTSMSQAGGLGLGNQLLATFERQIAALEHRVQGPAAPGQSVTRVTEPLLPSSTPLLPAPMPLMREPRPAASPHDVASGAVSSAFGWRRDPLDGTARFHAGVDLAVAYGQDVKSAAGGVVSFAGTKDGYGQTVVIDHGGGRQTRYAHLSQPLVKAGDTVSEGQVVARSGNSGRSTGPHLHFEMLVNGRAVDPFSGQI